MPQTSQGGLLTTDILPVTWGPHSKLGTQSVRSIHLFGESWGFALPIELQDPIT